MRFRSMIFTLVAMLMLACTANAQFNPSSNPPTLTIFVGQTTTLSVEGYNPNGLSPYLLDTPYRCMNSTWQYWSNYPNTSVLSVSKTTNTITITALAVGSTAVGAYYSVTDCYGNSTGLIATLNVKVVAQPQIQYIYGDSLLYFVPSAPAN